MRISVGDITPGSAPRTLIYRFPKSNGLYHNPLATNAAIAATPKPRKLILLPYLIPLPFRCSATVTALSASLLITVRCPPDRFSCHSPHTSNRHASSQPPHS